MIVQHKGGQAEGQERHPLPRTSQVEAGDDHDSDHHGPDEVLREVAARCLSPGDDRADARQGQQSDPYGQVHAVEERRTHRDRLSREPFTDQGKEGAPHDGEGDPEEYQVVEEKRRFPGEERLDLVLALQVRIAPSDQQDTDPGHHPEEGQEDKGDGRVLPRTYAPIR